MSAGGGQGWRGALSGLAVLGMRRSGLVLAIFGALSLVALALVPGIEISTSRRRLVDEDNAYQVRIEEFSERFGLPDSPVIVVEGRTEVERRALVDALVARLERVPSLEGKVLGRLGPDELAEVLLLEDPRALSRLRVPGEPPGRVGAGLSGGVASWLGLLEARARSQLEADLPAGDGDARLEELATLVRALDAELAGRAGATGVAGWGQRASGKEGLGAPVDDAGYLVATSGRHHLIALFPSLPGDEGHQVEPVVDAIRAARDEVLATSVGEGLDAPLTGLPAIVTDELRIVRRGLLVTSLVSSLAILGLLVVAFRSARHAVLALVPLGAGTLMTLAVVRVIYGELNLITASFVSVLLGLGIDFGVHLLARYGELRRGGDGADVAIERSLVRSGPGLLTGAATTALAFLSVTTVEFTAFAELGVITAVGLTLMFVCTFALIPPLLRRSERGAGAAPELPVLSRLIGLARNRAWAFVGAAALVTGVSALGLDGVRFNSRYFDFLPEETESAAGLVRLEADGAMSPVFATFSTDGVEAAREKAAALRALPEVGHVDTPSDLFPPLDDGALSALREGLHALGAVDPDALRARNTPASAVLPRVGGLIDVLDEARFAVDQAGGSTARVDEAKAALVALRATLKSTPDVDGRIDALEDRVAGWLERALPVAHRVAERGHYGIDDVPPLLRSRFVSKDGAELALYAVPRGDPWRADVAAAFAHEVERIDPRVAGLALTIHHHDRMIVGGFERAAAISAALVLVVLLLSFRKLSDALLAMTPVALGALWTLGAMSSVGLSFNVANLVALPLMIGIGIDAGAHMVHRARESADEHGGVARLDELVRGTGGAVALSSVTTMAGFAALMSADYGAMKSLGLLLTVGIGGCLAATVLVLPALLVILRRAR